MKHALFTSILFASFSAAAASADIPAPGATPVANPASKSPLFQTSAVLQLEVRGDFTKIKKVAQADGDGMETPDRHQPKYFTDATLKDLAQPLKTVRAKIRARGMSNLWSSEAQFPKLRVEIADGEILDGTVFKGAKNFRINTHVSTNPKKTWTEMGRLNNEKSPWREALAFDEAKILGLETPAIRRARIHYFDVGSKTDFTRNALLIETDKKIGERTNSKMLTSDEFLSTEDSKIDRVYGAKYFLFHALIGNADTGLKVNETNTMMNEFYRPIFNTTVFERAGGSRFAIVYDMDMASQVSGFILKCPTCAQPEFGLNYQSTAELANDFLRLRVRFTTAQLMAAMDEIRSKRAELETMIKSASVDEDGRKDALHRLDYFFPVFDVAMKLKVIGSDGVRFFDDVKKTKDKMQENVTDSEGIGKLRIGTPVKILGEEAGLLKVRIIDVRADLADGESPIGYIEKTARIVDSIDESLVGIVDGRDFTKP